MGSKIPIFRGRFSGLFFFKLIPQKPYYLYKYFGSKNDYEYSKI